MRKVGYIGGSLIYKIIPREDMSLIVEKLDSWIVDANALLYNLELSN